MELIIGFIMCGVISVGIHVYLRYFATDGTSHRPFERWCRTRPLVMALRCQPGAAIEVYENLRRQVEPNPFFVNSQGRLPWQHYAVHLDGRRADNDVVLVHVTECRHPKVREELPDLARMIDGLGRNIAPLVEEIWLHGQLHAVNRRTGVEREQLGWLGAFEDSGELQVSAMIGQPEWLRDTLKAA